MSGAPLLRVRCPAKLNLFLEVRDPRPDGFHDLTSLFVTIGLFDTLEIARGGSGIQLTVDGADLPTGEGNLVWRAARLFLDRFALDGDLLVHLVKRVPAEAGLGGGSSDAAGTLRGLSELLRPQTTLNELRPLALDLGSDVPFFLEGGAAVGMGRGERLTQLPDVAPGWVVLFLPPFGLSTAEVFRAHRPPERPRDEGAIVAALRQGLTATAPHLFNRLFEAAVRVEPRLEAVRAELAADLVPEEGLLLTGSGSALFAIVAGAGRAAELARMWNDRGMGRALAVRAPSFV